MSHLLCHFSCTLCFRDILKHILVISLILFIDHCLFDVQEKKVKVIQPFEDGG